MIQIYDGIDEYKPILKQFCDVHNEQIVLSTGPYLFIKFISDDRHERQGFSAEYEFIDGSTNPPNGKYLMTDFNIDHNLA